MSRLQKKCLIASAVTHLVLCFVLLFGPGFLTSPRPVNLPVLNVIPSKLVDDLLSGGGNPHASPPASAKSQPAPTPPEPQPPTTQPQTRAQPDTPPPKPERVRPRETVKPPKPDPEPTNEKSTEPIVDKRAEKAKQRDALIEASLAKTIKKKVAPKTTPDDSAADDARARAAENLQRLNGMVQQLANGLSHSTSIEMPGPGGAAFANYGQAVQSIYDHAWRRPGDAPNQAETVTVEVVIARDGRVIRSSILKRSGHPTLDKSIQITLDAVNMVQPFPEGATDAQRTFDIKFYFEPDADR